MKTELNWYLTFTSKPVLCYLIGLSSYRFYPHLSVLVHCADITPTLLENKKIPCIDLSDTWNGLQEY